MAGKNKLKNKSEINGKPDSDVSKGGTPPQGVVVSGGPKHSRKKVYVAVGVLLVVLAAIFHQAWVTHEQNTNREKIVTQAVALLKQDDTAKLATVIANLEKQPGYATDPNSLYVITDYYINLADSKNSQKFYDKLTAIYSPAKGYSNKDVKATAIDPSDLKATVTFLQTQATQAQNNFIGTPVPQ